MISVISWTSWNLWRRFGVKNNCYVDNRNVITYVMVFWFTGWLVVLRIVLCLCYVCLLLLIHVTHRLINHFEWYIILPTNIYLQVLIVHTFNQSLTCLHYMSYQCYMFLSILVWSLVLEHNHYQLFTVSVWTGRERLASPSTEHGGHRTCIGWLLRNRILEVHPASLRWCMEASWYHYLTHTQTLSESLSSYQRPYDHQLVCSVSR